MAIKKYSSSLENRHILESAKCREIVHEIMNFGVSQHQILTIIKLLSMELEDVNMMKTITQIIDADENEENESISKTTTILT